MIITGRPSETEESHIERLFSIALGELRCMFIPQHKVQTKDGSRYRLDFAIPSRRIAVELDGHAHHSTIEQFVNDRQRQRKLEADGWRIIRFAGREVVEDATRCVAEACDFAIMFGDES